MWIYRGKPLLKAPEGYYGFVYIIRVRYDDRTLFYIGKKAFSHRKKKRLSKKAKEGTRKRIQVLQVDSGWQDYWGSSDALSDIISSGKADGVHRQILKLARDKISLSYWECAFLFRYNAIHSDECLNGNILGKFFRGRIHK